MGVFQQLAIQVQHAAPLVGGELDGLEGELHLQVALLAEEDLADTGSTVQLLDQLGLDGRAELPFHQAALHHGFEVDLIEAVQRPTRREEALHLGKGHILVRARFKRITTGQLAVEGGQHLVLPLLIERGHGQVDHQSRALLGELTHPAIERGRQAAGILLQREHRIGVLVGHAQLHRFQGGLARLGGVDDELQVVLQLHQLLVDLLNERPLLTTSSQYSISGHKGTTDAGADGLGRVPFHVGDLANAGVVIQRGQHPLERLIVAGDGGKHVQRLLRALQGLHIQIGQQFLPLVDVIGDVTVVDLTGDLLAIRLAQLAQLALAQHPGIHRGEIDEGLVLLEEEVVETGPGEQPRHLAGVVAAQGKHGVEGGAHLVTHIEIRRQYLVRLHHQVLVDPLIHGQLAKLALGTVDRLLEGHEGGDGGLIPLGSGAIPVGVIEGIVQVPHQLLLYRPLSREGLLPAARHVLRHQLLVATGRIVQHPHHPQDGKLLFAAGRRLV